MAVTAGPWADADRYKRYVGRWSRPVARRFLEWLAQPTGARWLDVGCGTGALTETILASADPAQVVGIDPAPAFVEAASARLADPRASFRIGDAQALDDDLTGFDAVVSGLVLNFVPDKDRALAEMTRAARPGGTVAAYIWDYAEGMQLMRYFWDSAGALFAEAREIDEGIRFAALDLPALEALFGDVLHDVNGTEITIPTRFSSFEDYWQPFLGGTGPAPAFVVSLPADDQARLREALRLRLPVDANGSIPLKARAWAVRGIGRRA